MNFGVDGRGAAESSIVEGSEVLRDRPVGLGVELIRRIDPALAVSVRHDQAGIDGEAIAADQTFDHAPPHHRLEQLAQQISVAEPAVARLGESRMVWHGAVEAEATEME